MRNQVEIQEIENLGEQAENFPEENFSEEEFAEYDPYDPGEAKRQEKGSLLPLLQTALCVMALLALLILKMTDMETYSKATQWYQSEAAREIEWPKFGTEEEQSSLPPAESTETPMASELNDGSLQRL